MSWPLIFPELRSFEKCVIPRPSSTYEAVPQWHIASNRVVFQAHLAPQATQDNNLPGFLCQP